MRASSETHSWAAVPEHQSYVSISLEKFMVDMQAYSEMVTSPAHFASYSPLVNAIWTVVFVSRGE